MTSLPFFKRELAPGTSCRRLVWVRVSDETSSEQDMQSAFARAIRPLPDALRAEAEELGLDPLFNPERFEHRLQFFLGEGTARAVGMFLSDGLTFVIYALASATSVTDIRSRRRDQTLARFFGDVTMLVAPSERPGPNEDPVDAMLRATSNFASELLKQYLRLLRPHELVVAEASRLWRAIRFGSEVLEVIKVCAQEVTLGGRSVNPRTIEGAQMLSFDLVMSSLSRQLTEEKTNDGRVRKVLSRDHQFPFASQTIPLGWKRTRAGAVEFDPAALPVIKVICAHVADGADYLDLTRLLQRIRLLSPMRNRGGVWIWDPDAVREELRALEMDLPSAPSPDLLLSDEGGTEVKVNGGYINLIHLMVGFWHAMEYRGTRWLKPGVEPPEPNQRVEVMQAPDGAHHLLLRLPLPGSFEPIADLLAAAYDQSVRFFTRSSLRRASQAVVLPLLGSVLEWSDGGYEYRAKSQVSGRPGSERAWRYDVRRRPVGTLGRFSTSGAKQNHEGILAIDANALHHFVAEGLIGMLEAGVPAGIDVGSPFGPGCTSLRDDANLRSMRLEVARLDTAAERAFSRWVDLQDDQLGDRAKRHAEAAESKLSDARLELARLEATAERVQASGGGESREADVAVLVRALSTLRSCPGPVPREVAADFDKVLRLRIIPAGPLEARVHAAVLLPLRDGGTITMFADLGRIACGRRYRMNLEAWQHRVGLPAERPGDVLERLAAPARSDGHVWWRRQSPPTSRVLVPAAFACDIVMSGEMSLSEYRRQMPEARESGVAFEADVADMLRRAALMHGLSVRAKDADILVNCPAADVRSAVWAAIWGRDAQQDNEAFAAHVARTYLGRDAVPRWPPSPHAVPVSGTRRSWRVARGVMLPVLRALSARFGTQSFTWDMANEFLESVGLKRLSRQCVLTEQRNVCTPPLAKVRSEACSSSCTDSCRQHLRGVQIARCPHDDCDGLLDVYATVPELPERQLCSTCRRLPGADGPRFPETYLQVLLAP